MDSERERIEEILAGAVTKASAAERAAYLDRACGDVPQLRAQVEALLRAHDRAGNFLEVSVELRQVPPADNHIGTKVGHYRLLQKIGEGGFGVVYRAEQVEPVKRTVALKIIKPGMDTTEVVARFEAERQALALMDHPNIARVLDAGTTENERPYFVMELVEGVPLTQHCDQHRLSTTERLHLFIKVCHAVQHAHQKGIIHRDLKPTNVLVVLQDGAPVPKIIDFGVAKALGQKLTEKTLYTAFQQLVGTPTYMSPEQAELTGSDVDTRSDIYSLGVLLYELLTGVTPFDAETLRQGALDEVRRMICEKEPPKPSTRLRTLGAKQTEVAKYRKTQPETLTRLLHGDLDWIVMKCLEKDRSRRYATANALALDLEQHLQHQPVTAAAPTLEYRVTKFARRHRVALLTVTAFALLLVAGTAISLREAILATRNAEQSRRNLIRLHLANSSRLLESGDCLASLSSVAKALKLAHGHPEDENAYQRRLAMIAQGSPRIVQMWFHEIEPGPAWLVAANCFSPDGRYAVSGSRDCARIWDTETGELRRTVHHAAAGCAAISPDGKVLVTGNMLDAACSVRIWDFESGRELIPPLEQSRAIYNAAFSPDGHYLVTSCYDPIARIWDVQNGRLGRSLPHPSTVHHAEFSPDGTRVVTACWDGGVRLWDSASGELLRPPLLHAARVQWASFSPDGGQLVTADGTQASLWDCRDGRRIAVFPHSAGVEQAFFDPKGDQILTCSADRTIRFWDAKTAKPCAAPLQHPSRVNSAALDRTGRHLLTTCADGTVRLWALAVQNKTFSPWKEPRKILGCSDSGARLISQTASGEIEVWDTVTWKPTSVAIPVTNRVVKAGIGIDEKRLLVAAVLQPDTEHQLSVETYGISDGKLLSSLTLTNFNPKTDALYPDPRCQRLAVVRQLHLVEMWDLLSGKPLWPAIDHSKHPNIGEVWSVVFSPDGSEFLANCWIFAHVTKTDTGREIVPSLQHSNVVTSMRYNPDGRLILTGCWYWEPKELEARLWESATGKLLRSFKHRSGVGMSVFSPNGALVATASEDTTVRVWETASGRPRSQPLLHSSAVRCVAFSPDSRWLATGCYDGTVRLWDWAMGEPLNLPFEPEQATEHAAQFLGDGSVLLIYPWQAARNRPLFGKLIKLPDFRGNADDWISLAGFLSGHEIDDQGGLVPLSPNVLSNSFSRLRLRLPEYVGPRP